MLQFLNIFFLVFHSLWILFVCLGWIWRRTRLWNLVAVVLTALSWFGLGIWYGWGFCLCTHWHWQMREKLGYQDGSSYTQLLMVEITGLDVPSDVADGITVATFAVAALLSIALNLSDFRANARKAR
jgi:hypothetical protein